MGEPVCERCGEAPAFEVAPNGFVCATHLREEMTRSYLSVARTAAEALIGGRASLVSPLQFRISNLYRLQPLLAGRLELNPSMIELAERVRSTVQAPAQWRPALGFEPDLDEEDTPGFVESLVPSRGMRDRIRRKVSSESRTAAKLLFAAARDRLGRRLGMGEGRASARNLRELAFDEAFLASDASGRRSEWLLRPYARAGEQLHALRPLFVHWASSVRISDELFEEATASELAEMLLEHEERRDDFLATALYWVNEPDATLRDVRLHRFLDQVRSATLRELATDFFDRWSDGGEVIFDFRP